MIYVTVDMSADRENWHLNVLERVTRGIKGLEKQGFKVERYSEFEGRQPVKWLLCISLPGENGEGDKNKKTEVSQ